MELHFEKTNESNRKKMEALSLFPFQKGFIETVEDCLKEADGDARWHPVGIYDKDELVGFSMYGKFGNRVWLDRLLIDKAYQGKGYGKSSAEALIKKLREEFETDRIYLSVYDDNPHAIELYKKEGFRFNGELDENGEKIMVLDL